MIAAHSLAALLVLSSEGPLSPFTADGPDLTRYVVVCGVLVVLAGLLMLALRKGLAATVRARAARRSLAVLDVLPLGGRQRLIVVRCYDRTFLLGVGDKELTPVAELDAVVGAEAQTAAAPLPADRDAFASALEQIRKSMPAPRLGKPAAADGMLTPATSAGRAADPGARAASERAAAPSAPKSTPRRRPETDPAREQLPERPRLEGIVG